jgi:NADH-quinone oxidoreductase subunit K
MKINPYIDNYEMFLLLKGYFFKTDTFYEFYKIFDISINEALALSALIFLIGIIGIITNRNNLILLLLAIELMLLGISLNFIFFSIYLNNPMGFIYSLLILSLAAAETSIGLALLVVYFRLTNKILLNSLTKLRA